MIHQYTKFSWRSAGSAYHHVSTNVVTPDGNTLDVAVLRSAANDGVKICVRKFPHNPSSPSSGKPLAGKIVAFIGTADQHEFDGMHLEEVVIFFPGQVAAWHDDPRP